MTSNRSDFPVEPLGKLGLRVVDPDTYLQELLAAAPEEVVGTLVRLADEKRRPMRYGSATPAYIRWRPSTAYGRL